MTRDLTVRVESNGAYWKAIVSLPGGLRKTRSLGPKSKLSKRAASKLAQHFAVEWAERAGVSSSTETHTFLKWFDKTTAKRAKSKATHQTYLNTRTHLDGPISPRLLLEDVNKEHAKALREHLIDKGLSEQTVRGHCRRAKVAWTEAHREGIVFGPNPFNAVPTSTVKVDQEWQYVPVETIRKLSEALPDGQGVSLMIARLAGLRRGEVRRLKWENVHFASRIIRVEHQGVRTTKRKARTVPMCPELYDFLLPLKGEGNVAPPVTRSLGSRMYASIDTACRILGLTLERPYQDCRMSCINDWCLILPLSDVASIAGNSPNVIMENYHQVLASQMTKITGQPAPKLPQQQAPNAILSDHYAVS